MFISEIEKILLSKKEENVLIRCMNAVVKILVNTIIKKKKTLE